MFFPALLLGSLALAPAAYGAAGSAGVGDAADDGPQRAGDRDPLSVGTIVGASQEQSERAGRASYRRVRRRLRRAG